VQQPGVREPAPEPLRLVQDLVNTVDLESETGEELLTPADLAAWVRAHGGPDGTEGAHFGDVGLAEVIELREALRDACQAHAGVDMAPAAVAALDLLLARGPLRLAVDETGTAAVRPADGLTGVAALTARIAAAVAAGAADGSWQRLKACASDTCRWVYYDRSPAGRSRWCTMAVCGSRAKMRTYRKNKAG
jgi:predicted RNA-binding Zn ribbon-like protein